MKKPQLGDKISFAAMIISLIALVFSGFTFYFQSVRESNQLIVTNPLTTFANTGAFEFDVLLHNSGNTDQAVVRLQLAIKRSGSTKSIFDNEISPFVVKSGEIVHKKLKLRVPGESKAEKCALPKPTFGNYQFFLSVINSDSTASEKEREILLGELRINHQTFEYDSSRVQERLELEGGRENKTRTGMRLNMSGPSGVEERPDSWRMILDMLQILELTYGKSAVNDYWLKECAEKQ